MVTRTGAVVAAIVGVLATASIAAARQEEGPDAAELGATPKRLDAVRRLGGLLGTEVRGSGGEGGVGRVSDLVLDGQGRLRYGLLGPGSAPEEGGDLVPVPASALTIARLEEEDWFFLVNVDRARLRRAPAIGTGGVDALRDPDRRADIDAYFRPVGAAEDEATAAGVEARDSDLDADAALIRASALLGCDVFGDGPGGGEAVARVDELLIDEEYRVLYAVLLVDCEPSRQVPVPFAMLRLEADPGGGPPAARIGLGRDRLEAAPALEDDWPRMLNGSFIEAVGTVLGVPAAVPDPGPQP